jgi:L-Ala-D/L-Glu epimerase
MSETRIESLRYHVMKMERRGPFLIATGRSDSVVNLLVILRTPRLMGLGVAAPNSVTNEDERSIAAFLDTIAARLEGVDALDMEGVWGMMEEIDGHPAAKAGVDAALHDIRGKAEGVPVFRMLGEERESMETFVTIGIMGREEALRRARQWVEKGFRRLKVKVGLDLRSDIDRLKALRERHEGVMIGVDCNQGYERKDALEMLEVAHSLGIEFVEQPVRAEDWETLAFLGRRSSVPIMVDESVMGPRDLDHLASLEGVPLVNIKLAKCGGIRPAREMCDLCSEGGIGIMIGCMSECQGSIAAGLHLTLAHRRIAYADLDSHLSLVGDPTVALTCSDGRLFPLAIPGLGIGLHGDYRP